MTRGVIMAGFRTRLFLAGSLSPEDEDDPVGSQVPPLAGTEAFRFNQHD